MKLQLLLPLALLLAALRLSAQESPKYADPYAKQVQVDKEKTSKVVAGTLMDVTGNQATVRFDKQKAVTVELMKSAMTVKDGKNSWAVDKAPPNKRLYFEMLTDEAAQTRIRSIGERDHDVSPLNTPPTPGTYPTSGPATPATPSTTTPKARLTP